MMSIEIGPTQIKGDYKKLGAFNSLQLSFPPNYGLGTSLVIPKEEVDPTANFRTFLSVMDQIRGDWSAQMENLSDVFSIDRDKKRIATENIAQHPFYAGTGVPEPLPIKDKIKEEFEEKRLNYLLALNGWSHIIELPVLKEKEVLKEYKSDLEIKQAFLNLVHYGVEAIEPVNKQLNSIFQATSLVLLQESIRVVLSREQCEVRILEHCFLQPVANKSLGVNFELTVFLFIPDRLDVERSRIEEWEGDAKRLLIGFVPAHIVAHVQFFYNKSVQGLDEELIRAYPKDTPFYFNGDFSNQQLDGMRNLMNDWVLV